MADDYRNLKGADRAAIMMLALGQEHCARLFGMMHEDEIKDISSAMATLGNIKAETVEKVCNDFVENMGATGTINGSFESTESLLMKALPRDRVQQIMEEIRGPAGRTMWDKLGNVSEDVLANYLKNEYPQTVAVVLSKIGPEHAARVKRSAMPKRTRAMCPSLWYPRRRGEANKVTTWDLRAFVRALGATVVALVVVWLVTAASDVFAARVDSGGDFRWPGKLRGAIEFELAQATLERGERDHRVAERGTEVQCPPEQPAKLLEAYAALPRGTDKRPL